MVSPDLFSEKNYKLLAEIYVDNALRSFVNRKFFLLDYKNKTYGGIVNNLGDFNGVSLFNVIKIQAPLEEKLVEAIIELRKEVKRVSVDESIFFDRGVLFYARCSKNTLSYLTPDEQIFLRSKDLF